RNAGRPAAKATRLSAGGAGVADAGECPGARTGENGLLRSPSLVVVLNNFWWGGAALHYQPPHDHLTALCNVTPPISLNFAGPALAMVHPGSGRRRLVNLRLS